MATNYQEKIERVAIEALDVFETISSSADRQLGESYSTGPASLASVNTFTSGEAIKLLGDIDGAQRQSLAMLVKEPAIARVVTQQPDGRSAIYYICRGTPAASTGGEKRLAGRNSPAGRLASLDVGDEYELRTPGLAGRARR